MVSSGSVQSAWHIRSVWATLAITVVLAIIGLGLFWVNLETTLPATWGTLAGKRSTFLDWFMLIGQMGIAVLASFLGMLIQLRLPHHQIGQLLMATGLVLAIALLVLELTAYFFFTLPTPPPGSAAIALLQNTIWIMPYMLLIWMLAVFPTGVFISRWWQYMLVLSLFLFAAPTFANALLEETLASAFSLPNPMGVQPIAALYLLASSLGVIFLPASAFVALASLIVRFRFANSVERQQIRWLLIAMTITVFAMAIGLTLAFASTYVVLGQVIVMMALLPPIVGMGIAVLRYRLYDIDLFIRRTLQYSLISGMLALTYFGLVVALQRFIGEGQPQLITVASTLAIAALFLPLRQRVQGFIDKRFYRKKYDAQQVLATFAATCRDETDLERLTAKLVVVVEETIGSDQVQLWELKRTDWQ